MLTAVIRDELGIHNNPGDEIDRRFLRHSRQDEGSTDVLHTL